MAERRTDAFIVYSSCGCKIRRSFFVQGIVKFWNNCYNVKQGVI